MKKLFIIILLGLTFCGNAQMVRPFLDLSVSRSTEFKENYLGNIGLGLEVRATDYLLPEIQGSFAFGTLNSYENIEKIDDKFITNYIFERRFSAFNLTIVPKIAVYQSDSNLFSILLLPKYTYSEVKAEGFYYQFLNGSATSEDVVQEVIYTPRHSFGIGVSFYLYFYETKEDSLSLNLFYNHIDYGSALNSLKYSTTQINTKDLIGFGLCYYFKI